MRLAQVLGLFSAVANQAAAASPQDAVVHLHVRTASGAWPSTSAPGLGANVTSTEAPWPSSNTTKHATISTTIATQASETTSQPPDTTAGATPQHAESSMVGLLGFFIVGLLVL